MLHLEVSVIGGCGLLGGDTRRDLDQLLSENSPLRSSELCREMAELCYVVTIIHHSDYFPGTCM